MFEERAAFPLSVFSHVHVSHILAMVSSMHVRAVQSRRVLHITLAALRATTIAKGSRRITVQLEERNHQRLQIDDLLELRPAHITGMVAVQQGEQALCLLVDLRAGNCRQHQLVRPAQKRLELADADVTAAGRESTNSTIEATHVECKRTQQPL